MHPPHYAVQSALAVLVLVAAGYDVRYRRIPNWLTVSGLAAGLALNGFLGGWGGLKTAGAGFAVAFGAYFLLYAIRAMGAGDVKLMGAVGALAGPSNWLFIFVVTAIFGGLAALGLSLARGRLRRTLWNVMYLAGELLRFRAPYLRHEELDVKSEKAMKLPHGLSIAVGTATFLLYCLFK